jgi:hypothetical protein
VPPKGDKFRIAVVGDSFAYGQGILESERFSEQLAVLLEQAAPRAFEVYNFARPGTETVDHIEILKQSVLPTNPDFVLLQWYVNDAENGRYDGRPSFFPLLPSATASSYLNDHSALYYLLNDAWQRVQAATGIVSRRNYVEYMVERFGDPSSESAVLARERIVEFVTSAKQDGGTMVGIVMFPQLTDGLLSDYPLGFMLDSVRDTCTQLAVTCADLRSVFDPVQPKQSLWANRLDSHPGVLANALAAQAILKAFAAEWGVDP